jgi:hypothetical protein
VKTAWLSGSQSTSGCAHCFLDKRTSKRASNVMTQQAGAKTGSCHRPSPGDSDTIPFRARVRLFEFLFGDDTDLAQD